VHKVMTVSQSKSGNVWISTTLSALAALGAVNSPGVRGHSAEVEEGVDVHARIRSPSLAVCLLEHHPTGVDLLVDGIQRIYDVGGIPSVEDRHKSLNAVWAWAVTMTRCYNDSLL
jgi:hypothetical protein